MRLEFVTKRLPRKFGLALEILIDAAIGYFAWFLLTQGTVLTQATWDSMMSTIPMPLGLTYLVIPIAAVFMIAFALFRIVNKVYEARKAPEEKGGPADAR
jgi:TRAP-type C4-dicarboxylate transport system permease small subunit